MNTFKGTITFEQKPDTDTLATHAVRFRHNGIIAKSANIKRGDIIQIKAFHVQDEIKIIYRIALLGPMLKSKHVRMDYDNLVELNAQKISAFKGHEGESVDVEIKTMNNPAGKALFLWKHPDPSMRFAVHSFIYSIMLGIVIDVSLSILSIAMTT